MKAIGTVNRSRLRSWHAALMRAGAIEREISLGIERGEGIELDCIGCRCVDFFFHQAGSAWSRRLRKNRTTSRIIRRRVPENQDAVSRNARGRATRDLLFRPVALLGILLANLAHPRHAPAHPAGNARPAQPRHAADQEAMAAPLHAAIEDRVEPDRQQQDILDGAEDQVLEPRDTTRGACGTEWRRAPFPVRPAATAPPRRRPNRPRKPRPARRSPGSRPARK